MQINNCTRDLNIHSNQIIKHNSTLINQSSTFISKNKNTKISDKLKEVLNQKQEMEENLQKIKENRENCITQLKSRIEDACNQFKNLANQVDCVNDELEALKEGKVSDESNGLSKKDILKSLEELNKFIADSRIELEDYTKNSAKEIEKMKKAMEKLNNSIKDNSKYNLTKGLLVEQYK